MFLDAEIYDVYTVQKLQRNEEGQQLHKHDEIRQLPFFGLAPLSKFCVARLNISV